VFAFDNESDKMKFGDHTMAFKDFMNRVRYLDNLTAKWLMRHFYFLFFQIVLVIIFLFWFVNLLGIIDVSFHLNKSNISEDRLLMTQSINMSILTILLLLNSFWMLYIFNVIQRLNNLLKDISYNITKLRMRASGSHHPRRD